MNQQNEEKRKMMEVEKNSGKKLPKSSIFHLQMPAELLNELFGSLPVENGFGFLAKMPNGLLARNVQKMINEIKEAMESNKWNAADHGPILKISDDGIIVSHAAGPHRRNIIRSLLPIPPINLRVNKPIIVFYFEIQILNKISDHGIGIGICTKELPLENKTFECENSIGIGIKGAITIDGSWTDFGETNEWFNEGDIVGLGIIYYPPAKSSMKYFATLNGELLGKAELPTKFASLKLFPTVSLYFGSETIMANFGIEEWSFKKSQKLFD